MVFDHGGPSSRPLSKNSTVLMNQLTPSQDDGEQALATAQEHRSESRLKKISDATLKRLSLPLSFISFKSSSSSRDKDRPKPLRQKSSKRDPSTGSPLSAHSSRNEAPTSTLDSVLEPEAKDDLGQLPDLPVFGMSQRGYLASLVSLFSDGHDHDNTSSNVGTPVSANTVITSPSLGPPSLGLYEYDINSASIYPYSNAEKLYVGWPKAVHPPPEALLEFEMETLPLLERDLQSVSGRLGQRGIRITYELRMSGYVSPISDTVTLSPTVWILYRPYTSVPTRVSLTELHEAVSGLFYLQRNLEIQEGGGRIELNSDRKVVDVDLDDKYSIKLSAGGALSIHVEDCQERDSACSALCCITMQYGKTQIQSLSRLGGLLQINGKYILGVSTAHAMLDSCGIFNDSFDGNNELRIPKGQAVDRDIIVSEASKVSKWHNVTRDAAIDFLGMSMNSRSEVAVHRSKHENATDFALLRLRKTPGTVRNRYIPPGSEKPVRIVSTASASASAFDEGPVYVLCDSGKVEDGHLLWGSSCFIVRGRHFRVRRIQTFQPLRPSTSGSWVVKGEVLYGVIIAVYEDEPFALMMTAERFFGSILDSAFSVRSVELWDGTTPELYGAQSKGDVGRGSKQTPREPPRRHSSTRSTGTQTGGSRPPSEKLESTSNQDSRPHSRKSGMKVANTVAKAVSRSSSAGAEDFVTPESSTHVRDYGLNGTTKAPAMLGLNGEALAVQAQVDSLDAPARWRRSQQARPSRRGSKSSQESKKLAAPTAQLKEYLGRKLPKFGRRPTAVVVAPAKEKAKEKENRDQVAPHMHAYGPSRSSRPPGKGKAKEKENQDIAPHMHAYGPSRSSRPPVRENAKFKDKGKGKEIDYGIPHHGL